MDRILSTFSILFAVALVAACGEGQPRDHAPDATPLSRDSVAKEAAPALSEVDVHGWGEVEARAGGDSAHGKALVARYECNRCHAGTGQPAPTFERQCVHCHQLIAAGTLPFPADKLDAWRAATRHYITTPSLATVGRTLRASWVASFLHEPVKVRPHEEEWMPRLAISESDARDLAAYLTKGADEPNEDPLRGDAVRGKDVVSRKGCFLCHEFSGASRAEVGMDVPSLDPERFARARSQAPDLRLARARVRPDALVAWIANPASVRADALMPSLGLTDEEVRDAAAYILSTPLAALPPSAPPLARLPVLKRPVSYEEVATRVFRTSCTHCHADPREEGDPGPGSTGGFGFAPRGVQLLSFAGTQLGYLDHGARKSLFAREPALEAWGGSRLVAALVARHEETSGRPLSAVRGMPLGLPGLTPEQIQLVETWVAEGARER